MQIASPAAVAEEVTAPKRLWRRLAGVLDRLVANRTRRDVPVTVLRRSKLDFDRCRQLTFHGHALSAKAACANRRRSMTVSLSR